MTTHEFMREVWESPAFAALNATERAVLWAYIVHADADGVAWPSALTIAQRLGQNDDSHVRRARRALVVEHGLLAEAKRPNGRPAFRLNRPGRIPPGSIASAVTPAGPIPPGSEQSDNAGPGHISPGPNTPGPNRPGPIWPTGPGPNRPSRPGRIPPPEVIHEVIQEVVIDGEAENVLEIDPTRGTVSATAGPTRHPAFADVVKSFSLACGLNPKRRDRLNAILTTFGEPAVRNALTQSHANGATEPLAYAEAVCNRERADRLTSARPNASHGPASRPPLQEKQRYG